MIEIVWLSFLALCVNRVDSIEGHNLKGIMLIIEGFESVKSICFALGLLEVTIMIMPTKEELRKTTGREWVGMNDELVVTLVIVMLTKVTDA